MNPFNTDGVNFELNFKIPEELFRPFDLSRQNILLGPVRRGRGAGVSEDEQKRRIFSKAQELMTSCNVTDEAELERVKEALFTGKGFERIQNAVLRDRAANVYTYQM